MGRLLLVLWPIAIMHLLAPQPLVDQLAAVLFVVYIGLAVATAGFGNRVLAGGIMATAIALATVDGLWSLVLHGLEDALVFAAFLPTIYFLRSAAARHPLVLEYRTAFERVPPAQRAGHLLIGAHALGGALTVGALAVLSPVISTSADARSRRNTASAVVFGVSLAILWSPFFVAMAVVSDFMAHVALWQPIALGLVLAVLGLVIGLTATGGMDVSGLRHALRGLRRIVPLTAVAAVAVILLRAATGLSTLESACFVLPPVSALLLISQRRFARWRALRATRISLDRLSAEVSIVALAFVLAAVMRESPTIAHSVDALLVGYVPPVLLIAFITGGIALAATVGVHPMVAASVMLGAFAGVDTGLADLVLMGAVLLGWTCGAMLAVAGLIMIVAAGMFNVSRQHLVFGNNVLLVVLLAAGGTALLTGLNSLMV